MSAIKIIGVDPGTNLLGYAVVTASKKGYTINDMGEIHLGKFKDHQTKLKEIFLQLQEIIETHLPTHMAIEAPFYGKNPQSMLKLGRAQGVAMTAAITMGLAIHEYAPKRIKQAVTGSGNASKEQVAAMLESITGQKIVAKYLDATDALGAAICHYQSLNSPLAAGGGKGGWSSFVKNNPDKVRR
jgi:crossover junction endodeoxyribonuclease RuvC